MKKAFLSILILLCFLFTFSLTGQDNDIVVYGVIDASPPFMFVNDQGEADGFAVDLYTRMMGDLEIPYEIRIEKMNMLYKGLLDGQIDLFTGMLYTKENEGVFYFPQTSFKTSWGELFVGAQALYSDIYDLEGKTIGTVLNDINGQNFTSFMEQFEINYFIREFSTFGELFNAVREGEIFGGITNSQYQQKREDTGLKPTATTFYPSSTYAVTGLDNGNIEILEQLSIYLSELKSDPDSYYYELEQKWYNPGLNFLHSPVYRIILFSLLSLAGITFILFWNNRYLKREVSRQVEQIDKQEKEKEMVELKNDFLASISQELRTPMNSITSLIYLLSQSGIDRNQKDKINKINKASHIMLNVIDNFLDYNRLEKGQIILARQPFSLRGEIDEVFSHFLDDVKEKGLYLEKHLDNNIPDVLWGDSLRFTQILTNIIDNAVKFSNRGTITLAVFVEELSRNNCLLNITIKDQGIGINQDDQKTLFQPFSRDDHAMSRQFNRRGLSLALSYKLVMLMKGTIDVTSQRGRGSKFTLSLPFDIAKKEYRIERDRLEQFDSYEGARVLYVEDNPVNREIGQELLKLARIDAKVLENGLEALEELKREKYDLVLMDIQMPLMDGLSATRKIREQEQKEKSTRLPIVALTAHFLEEDINKAYEAGMDGHISKPISIGTLNKELKKWLSPYRIKNSLPRRPQTLNHISLPGIDMNSVREQFNDNYELFFDSITRFTSDYSLMPGLLISLGNQQKDGELKKELHTLKGVVGSLGMDNLYKKARNLEVLFETEKDYSKELKSFSFELEDYITSLEGKL